jgi:hypothetical protein
MKLAGFILALSENASGLVPVGIASAFRQSSIEFGRSLCEVVFGSAQ